MLLAALDEVESSLSGIGPPPRIRRNFHWPINTPPRTPSITATLSAPPLPSPPASILLNAKISATIAAAPDLFPVSTPINVTRLELALRDHPNRLLVVSVLTGLREGFRPFHDGDLNKLNVLEHRRASDEHVVIIEREAEKEIGLARLSRPLQRPYPGMWIAPRFVVERDGSKPRVVCDQNASGLNEGITKADAHVRYDSTVELALSMLHQHHLARSSNLLPFLLSTIQVWKSDVKGAFRNIPLHPRFQILQVARIDHLDRPTTYHVDHRMTFGN